jgi:hypothetical protein
VDALWVPQRLWCYAATNQPNGDFSKYTAVEIARAINYPEANAEELVKCLLAAGFMDKGPKIHNWDYYNGFHAVYKARAEKAAKSRWNKSSPIKTGERGDKSTGEDKHLNDASSMYRYANGSEEKE